ncbi:MAG: adenosylcobinamide-phosphate synthase CbiB [Planctomycetota bacterium]
MTGVVSGLLAAWGLDLVLGDPQSWPHPVRAMGKAAAWLETALTGALGRDRLSGILFTLILVGGTWLAAWALLAGAMALHPWLGWGLSVYLLTTCFATRDLADHALRVFRALKVGDLPLARSHLAHLVGRDTENLEEKEIVRGTVESVAESSVDGVLSPIVFAALGGAPLALAFKMASTLDSMVGHKNEKYLQFGWASARLDDALNWIPARLSRWIYPLAAKILGLRARDSWAIAWRDGHKSPSPNAAISEAAMAGALGVQLGGLNHYQGQSEERALLGEPLRELEADDILKAIQLMVMVSAWGLVLGLLPHFFAP